MVFDLASLWNQHSATTPRIRSWSPKLSVVWGATCMVWVLFLSGCFDLALRLELRNDGGGKLSASIVTDPMFAGAFRDKPPPMGTTVREFIRDGKYHRSEIREFTSLSSFETPEERLVVEPISPGKSKISHSMTFKGDPAAVLLVRGHWFRYEVVAPMGLTEVHPARFGNLEIEGVKTDKGALWEIPLEVLTSQTEGTLVVSFTTKYTAPPVPLPTLSGITPSPVPGLDGLQTLTLTGSGLTAGARVTLRTNGNAFLIPPERTKVVSPTQIEIRANVTSVTTDWTAEVENPGNYVSNKFAFRVSAPPHTPSITRLPSAGLGIQASALGSTARENGELLLTVPNFVSVEVTLSGSGNVPSGSIELKSVWEVNNVQVGEGSKLFHSFSGGRHKVTLTVFQPLTSAQSTPAVLRPSSLPGAQSAEVSIYVKETDDQACRGRIGRSCLGDFPGENIVIPATVTQDEKCKGPGTICIKSSVSVGSIKHDACCDAVRQANVRANLDIDGHWCSGIRSGFDWGKNFCELQWEQARDDWLRPSRTVIVDPDWLKSTWEDEWVYRVGDKDPPAAEWTKSRKAPRGAIVSEKDPDSDAQYCQSGMIEKVDVRVRFLQSTVMFPERKPLWVCK